MTNHQNKLITRRFALRFGASAGAVCMAGGSTAWSGCDKRDSSLPDPIPDAAQPAMNPPRVRLPKSVAGVPVPDSALAVAAADHVFGAASSTLFNHCMRTYVFAALLFDKMGRSYDRELAFIGAALHDLGLIDAFMSPTERFELDGADAARKFLEDHAVATNRIELVWDAIALHTNATIAARKAPEIAMVSLGAAMDAAGLNLDQLAASDIEAVLAEYPRLGFKQDAVKTMLELCRKKPFAQLMHPFAEVGRRHIPDFACPTIEDLMLSAAFPE